MDRSEIELFGNVRSAFHSKLWNESPLKFRTLMEEAYHLLPPDYQGYIVSNLEQVPDEIRRLEFNDIRPQALDDFLYTPFSGLDPFVEAYVRHIDFEYIRQNTALEDFSELYDRYVLALTKCHEINRKKPKGKDYSYSTRWGVRLCIPLVRKITLPHTMDLSTFPVLQYTRGRLYHLQHYLDFPNYNTLAVTDTMLYQGDVRRDESSFLNLTALTCNEGLNVIVKVTDIQDFLHRATMPRGRGNLLGYLRFFVSDYKFFIQLPDTDLATGLPTKDLVPLFENVLNQVNNMAGRFTNDISLHPGTWTRDLKNKEK